jgi:NAD(P)-dependent dehydrogenase (short-subunit alcohol dehydrogenase family)
MEMHQGLNLSRNPFEIGESSRETNPPKQKQEWPGHESKMSPSADHGENSYRGGGKLTGLKALITGGDSGIGRAVAIAFAREGADVMISYYNEHDDADETVNWVRSAGRKGVAIASDLKDPQECISVVEKAVQELGGINILVNNAAFQAETKQFAEITPEQLENTFRTNILSYFWVSQTAVKHMTAGDVIINTGSVVALMGHGSLIDYAATKGAIHTYTKSLAQLLSEKGIRVNCVAPGPVWTPLIASTRGVSHLEKFGSSTFWNRPAQPCEIAPSYVFLASTDSRFYTGEILSPSGTPGTTR